MKTVFLKAADANIEVTLRRSKRAKYMRITVASDGSVTLSRPLWATERQARRFLEERKDWVRKKFTDRVANTHPDILTRSREHYLKYKEKARRIVEKRVAHWGAFYGFTCNRISIRNQRSCWGSCSSKGNLNFSYKILFLPPELQDYLVVHELCHLKEMNHSKRFWCLVERAVPEYRERARALRSNGRAIG